MSVLDQIKSRRNRTKVPPRDITLVKSSQESTFLSEGESKDEVMSTTREVNTDSSAEPPAASLSPDPEPIEEAEVSTGTGITNIIDQIQAELDQFPDISRRSNIRVEAHLLKRLEQTCSEHKITLETFLEAAYVLFESNQNIQQPIIEEAQQRKGDRRRAGKLRQDLARLKTY